MNRSLTSSLAALTILSLAGCAPKEEEAEGILGEENSQAAGEALQASIEGGAAAYRTEESAAFGGSCISLSGNTADTDDDNIPEEVTVTYTDCSGTDWRGTATLNAVKSLRDDDPQVAAFLFTADASGDLALVGGNGGTLDVHHDHVIQGSQPGSEYQLDVDGTNSFEAHGPNGGFLLRGEETLDWVERYAPSAPWIPGLGPVAGTYSVNGTYAVSLESSNASVAADAVLTTIAPMTIDPACSTLVVGGSVEATYEGPEEDRMLSVTWTGCGQGSVSYSEAPAGS